MQTRSGPLRHSAMKLQGRGQFSAGFCIMLAFMLLTVPFRWLTAMILAAALHELAHLLAIRLLTGNRSVFRLFSSGARLQLPEMSCKKELLCALAGPMSGFALLGLARWAPRLALCGCVQSFYNLLPVYPMDGGRAIQCLLKMLCSPPKVLRISRYIAAICKAMILLTGLYGAFGLQLGLFPLIFTFLILIRIK